MLLCPQCGAHYQDGETNCKQDGAPLVQVRASQAMKVDPYLGRRIKDTYVIRSRIGAGGMGTVYKAVQERLGREVAIKLLPQHLSESEEAVLRFHREARSASSLTHPNTIIIYDYGQEEDGLLYLAMEYVAGKPLSKIIRRGELTPERTLHMLEQISASLMEAHGQGMIHRDLKPDNIMLTERGGDADFAKVLDFGLAKAVGRDSDNVTEVTAAGMVMGTPAYMSPEQIQNLTLTPASDQYALGVIAFEMITGKAPFGGGTSLSICMKHVSEEPPLMRDLHPEQPNNPQLEAVIRRCLAKDPEERFADVGAFVQELAPYLRGQQWRSASSMPQVPADSGGRTIARTGMALAQAPSTPSKRGGGSGVFVVAAVVAVLVLAGAVGGWALMRRSSTGGGPKGGAAAADGGAKARAEAAGRSRKRRYDKAMAAGRKAYEGKRYIKALEHFEQAQLLDRDSPEPYQWMGDTEKQRGNRSLARLRFKKYLELKEGHLAPTVMEAELHKLLGPDPAEAADKPPKEPGGGRGGRRGGKSPGGSRRGGGSKPTIDTAFE